jgi:hypothetical protein
MFQPPKENFFVSLPPLQLVATIDSLSFFLANWNFHIKESSSNNNNNKKNTERGKKETISTMEGFIRFVMSLPVALCTQLNYFPSAAFFFLSFIISSIIREKNCL